VLRRYIYSRSGKVLENKLRNKELRDFQCCPNIVRVIKLRMLEWAGYIACMEKMGKALNILPGNPEWMVLLRIYKWKHNIKINLKKRNGKT
jgi:hypothetical protein